MWMAYAEVEPFGEDRADLRSAIVAQTVYGCMRGRGSRSMTLADFMPDLSPKPTPEQLASRFNQFAMTHNQAVEAGATTGKKT